MNGPLLSVDWYRVAALHPRLRASVRVQRQRWRDQLWYLLSDDATGRQHLINEAAYRFIGRCDGLHDVQAAWDAVLAEHGEAAPTQDEVIGLLGQLDEQELLQCERTPDTALLFKRSATRRTRRRRALINPFSFRLPLGDPSALLARLEPVGHALLRPALLWPWFAVLLLAVLAAGSEWDALRSHALLYGASPRHLALAWLCFPIIKALHELAHGLAVRRFGGEVHEYGVALLALIPAPYVDATASSGFVSRRQRAMVAAAGIVVELSLAVLALAVWLAVQPGWVQDLAAVVLVITCASTLLFNANPLLRFDGYHVFCDLLDLPNLAGRSNAWWTHLVRRHVLRVPSQPPESAAGERKWLWLYAPLSFAYRVALSVGIALWLGAQWLAVGVLVALYLFIATLLLPLLQFARGALASAAPGRELRRVRLGLAGLALGLGLTVFVLPLPFTTHAPAVVWLPEQTQLRTEVAGFITDLPYADGDMIAPGELIAVLDNPELGAERDRVASKIERLRTDQAQTQMRDPLAAQNFNEDIERARAELALADERLDQLQVRAQVAGRLVMPRQVDLIGTYVKRGTPLGHLLGSVEPRVRAAVPEEDAYLVRNRTVATEVRLAAAPGDEHAGTVTHSAPAGTRVLPSAALGDQGGGPVPTDPADKDGLRSISPVFLIDLKVDGADLHRVGERAWVRFDHGASPLAAQLYRRSVQLLLKHFSPTD